MCLEQEGPFKLAELGLSKLAKEVERGQSSYQFKKDLCDAAYKERLFISWLNGEARRRVAEQLHPDWHNGAQAVYGWTNNLDAVAEDNYFRSLSSLADDLKPGTPECERFSEIAAKLKEIEAERQRAAQAATLPEEKK